MPRRARIMLSGIPVHVIQRGNNRQPCFYEANDRSFYLFHLGRLLTKAGCALHAHCLMTNHVHLLLTPNSLNSCGMLMKGIGQLHTQYMNRTYGRTGSLWEGRFRSCLVQAEDYLLACYRYIETNPLRANLVSHPVEYPWSSYRANAEGKASALVTPHEEYARLGHAGYKELVAEVLDSRLIDAIRAATNGNFALGDARFRQQVSNALGRPASRGSPGRPRVYEKPRNQLELLDRGQ
jgi:putative transposase